MKADGGKERSPTNPWLCNDPLNQLYARGLSSFPRTCSEYVGLWDCFIVYSRHYIYWDEYIPFNLVWKFFEIKLISLFSALISSNNGLTLNSEVFGCLIFLIMPSTHAFLLELTKILLISTEGLGSVNQSSFNHLKVWPTPVLLLNNLWRKLYMRTKENNIFLDNRGTRVFSWVVE